MQYVIFRNRNYNVKKNKLSLVNKGIIDISEIEGLEYLNDLKELDLSNNNITEIKNLENLSNLLYLNLSNNLITEIKGLENQKMLRYLWLSGNQIREITGLNALTNLMTLYLNNNDIEEIKGLDNLYKLNALYLEGNKIIDVSGIGHLKNLKRFDLGRKSALPKEKAKVLKESGVHIEEQHYFGKKRILKIVGYFIAVAIVDFIISAAICVGFELPVISFLPTFGILFLPCTILLPILYVIGRAYAGF